MNLKIEQVDIAQKPFLRNLFELYQYDFTEFNGQDVSEYGLFHYCYLDYYWTEAGRFPLFIRMSGKLAGFALIRTLNDKAEKSFEMAEFFVLRKYRRQSIGQTAACCLFDMFPGVWFVQQQAANLSAKAFWRRIIGLYTAGQFAESIEQGSSDTSQTFRSG